MEFERVAVGPLLVRLLEKIAAFGRARAVDQRIATLEALIDLGEDLLAGRQRAQVSGNGHWLRPYRGDGLGTFHEIGRIGCRQHRLRALTRESRRNGAADATAAAADHDYFSFKFLCHSFPLQKIRRLYTRIDLPALAVTIRKRVWAVSYTHLRAHETGRNL